MFTLFGELVAQEVHQEAEEVLQELREYWQNSRNAAIADAEAKGYPIRVQADNHQMLEIGFFENNVPAYFLTHSAGFRLLRNDSVSVSPVFTPRALGLSDAGKPLTTHFEFDANIRWMGSQDRSVFSHSTAMAGAMVARGLMPDAKSPAPLANLEAWSWQDDPAERLAFAIRGGLVSVHGYDVARGWVRNLFLDGRWAWLGSGQRSAQYDFRYGYYSNLTRDVDLIAWMVPHYLMIQSAGNERGFQPALQPAEHWYYRAGQWRLSEGERSSGTDEAGFRTISTLASAKNVLTVGAYERIENERQPANFSSRGPTSDGRVKPDIMAPGVGVYTTGSQNNRNYIELSGSSMAAARVGAVTHNLITKMMEKREHPPLSSTVRALLIHSAYLPEDAPPGPMFERGWGFLNEEKAIQLIERDQFAGGQEILREDTLKNGQVQQFSVESDGTEPLKITLAWTDPPAERILDAGLIQTGILVHDLDIRIEDPSGKIHEPFVLRANQPHRRARTGDNNRDNVEQILITDPSPGLYKVSVSHKRNLSHPQAYSLIITGQKGPQSFPVQLVADMSVQAEMGRFNPEKHNLMISGVFSNWNESPEDSTWLFRAHPEESLLYTIDLNLNAWPGQRLDYKLKVPDSPLGWERNFLLSDELHNRIIQIPESDTIIVADTLFFNEEREVYQIREVLFQVNMGAAKEQGFFKPESGDDLFVRGSFNHWARNQFYRLEPGKADSVYQVQIPIQGDENTMVSYLYFIETGDGRQIPNNGWEILGRFSGENVNREIRLSEPYTLMKTPLVYFSNDEGKSLISVDPVRLEALTFAKEYSAKTVVIGNPGSSDLHWNLTASYPEEAQLSEQELMIQGRGFANPFESPEFQTAFSESFIKYEIASLFGQESRWRIHGDSLFATITPSPTKDGEKDLRLGNSAGENSFIQSPAFLNEVSELVRVEAEMFITEYDGADYFLSMGDESGSLRWVWYSDAQMTMYLQLEEKTDTLNISAEWYAEWPHRFAVELDYRRNRILVYVDGKRESSFGVENLPEINSLQLGHNNQNNVDELFLSSIQVMSHSVSESWLSASRTFGSVAPGETYELHIYAEGGQVSDTNKEAELRIQSNAGNTRNLRIPIELRVLPQRQQESPYVQKDLRFRSYMLGGGPFDINLERAFDNSAFSDLRYQVIVADETVLRTSVTEISRRPALPDAPPIREEILRIEPLRVGSTDVFIIKRDEMGREISHQFFVSVEPKDPPVQIQEFPEIRLVAGREPELIPLNEYFEDPAGHQLSFEISQAEAHIFDASVVMIGRERNRLQMPGFSWVEQLLGTGSDVEYTGPALRILPHERGEREITITARDPFGTYVETSINVQVIMDESPIVVENPEPRDVLIQQGLIVIPIGNLFEDVDGGRLIVSAQSADEEILITNVSNAARVAEIRESGEPLRTVQELRGGRIESQVYGADSQLMIRPINLGETEISLIAINDLGRETEVLKVVRVLTEPDPIGPFALRNPEDFREISVSGDPEQVIRFVWTKPQTNLNVRYRILFDFEGGSFEEPILSIESNSSGRDTVLTISMKNLDAHLEALGIRRQTFDALDWTVRAQAGNRRRYSATQHTLNINRGVVGRIGFVNVRGPETRETMLGVNANISATVKAEGLTGTGEVNPYIRAWIGLYDRNIPPSEWPQSAWMEASFRQSKDESDIYEIQYGENLPEGTYYAASRFSIVGQEPAIGGASDDGGGFWHANDRPAARIVFRPLQLGSAMDVPADFILEQNFPNPFNPTTQIRYGLPEAADVRLAVYNMLGQEMAVLVRQYQNAGWYSVTFDATGLTSGTYVYRLQAGDYVRTRNMLYLR